MIVAKDSERIHGASRVIINPPILVPMKDEAWQEAISPLEVVEHCRCVRLIGGRHWDCDPDLWQQSALTGHHRAAPIFQLFLPEKNAG